ncbi:hypothetical protein GGTG_12086 [Gaeumannomyces tritici R3-111a-1]|uniref:Uncharacterized protein n=1 Tax=Gaeumannomyces tritici (strain R3-111a-1) TaxID=644352 RepID=J3PF07_GAET3|nr:hypothetical protein GGTG_12086 [Gaeumannomyces tritici R3-111a-1]EJT71065.1 hypothetical protein GGTG_12086 [Gaeumannomyces tritici R3-111a-1]
MLLECIFICRHKLFLKRVPVSLIIALNWVSSIKNPTISFLYLKLSNLMESARTKYYQSLNSVFFPLKTGGNLSKTELTIKIVPYRRKGSLLTEDKPVLIKSPPIAQRFR